MYRRVEGSRGRMRHGQHTVIAYAILAFTMLSLSFGYATAQSQHTITANVMVTCPMRISVAPASSYYVIPSNAAIDYAVKALVPCTIPSLTGYLNITNASTRALTYQARITVYNITGTQTVNSVSVPASTLGKGTSDANLSLTESYSYSNSTANTLLVLTPANIVVQTFAVSPSQVVAGSPVTIRQKIKNTGDLASGNMHMVLDVFDQGDALVASISTGIPSLNPGQTGTTTLTLSNITQNVGNFTVYGSVRYTSYGTNTSVSDNGIATYSVVQNPSQGNGRGPSHPSTPPPPPVNVGGYLSFTTVPLYMNLARGIEDLSSIGLLDSSSMKSIMVNITAPSLGFANITLSATSILLLPGQSQSIQFAVNGTSGTVNGTYIIPLNITVGAVNSSSAPAKETLFISADIEHANASEKSAAPAVAISYSSALDQASCRAFIRNPYNYTVNDSSVVIVLPLSVAPDANDISLSGGGVGTVVTSAGGYTLTWTVPQLKSQAGAYVYYTVDNVTNPQYLQDAPVSFAALSAQKSAQLVLLGLYAPTLYANQGGNVSVNLLYTGSASSPVTFELLPPQQITVLNNYQTVNATPDSSINRVFDIQAGHEGTYYVTLRVFGPLVNASYNMTVQVLPLRYNTSSGTSPQAQNASGMLSTKPIIFLYFFIGTFVMLVSASIAMKRFANVPRYDRSRAAKLVAVRERLKREKRRVDDFDG